MLLGSYFLISYSKMILGELNPLRCHVCRANFGTIFFLSCEFSYEKCSKDFPKMLSLYLVGPNECPTNLLEIFPAKKQK